jgi:hypothetical protein
MATVKLVDETCDHPIVRRVFDDIKATKKISFVPTIWRALAVHPEHLELCWTRLKAIMQPGKKLGLDAEGFGELLAVVGLYNQMNKLADALQVEPDILPTPY